MNTFEAAAVEKALTVYADMSADLMAAVGEQPVGEAMLTDLRAKSAADAAALGVVRGFIDTLPHVTPDEHHPYFQVDNVGDAARLRSSVMWGPRLPGNGKWFDPWSVFTTPYYVIGSRQLADTHPLRAKVLLMPAAETEHESAGEPAADTWQGMLIASTWAQELEAAEVHMAGWAHAKVDSADVARIFDAKTGTLHVNAEQGVSLNGVNAGRSARKVGKAVTAMGHDVQSAGRLDLSASVGRERVTGIEYDYTMGFADGLPRDARMRFNVFPRLVHLAALFDKTDVLHGLVRQLHDEDKASALEAFTLQQQG